MTADIVLIHPGDRRQVYQELASHMAAVEPPFLVAVLASYLRNNGAAVAIVDAAAENLSAADVADRVREAGPALAAVIVYGSQPSASTQNMTTAGIICAAVRETGVPVAIGGLHPSALPRQTLEQEQVDFVIDGEGFHTLRRLLDAVKSGGSQDLFSVPGLWYREGEEIRHTNRAPLIDDLDAVLPIAAWDLLPMDRYRAHNWHCFDNLEQRMPYGAIYTSLGCPYSCVFCCINAPFGKPGIRFRSPKLVVEEIDHLVQTYGIRNLKIVDELFILDGAHYMPIVAQLIERGYGLNIWAYARIDTVRQEHLAKMKKAGINWLALGIESANAEVHHSSAKRLQVTDMAAVVRAIQDAGIRVIGNYIFGLPEDSRQSMQETLDLALELNCEFANFYSAMAYPGSKLFDLALQNGWELPHSWHGYSQHAYETLPLPTKHLTAQEVLQFRDEAFQRYFTAPSYLKMVEAKFGTQIRSHIEAMTRTRLKRKILGD